MRPEEIKVGDIVKYREFADCDAWIAIVLRIRINNNCDVKWLTGNWTDIVPCFESCSSFEVIV